MEGGKERTHFFAGLREKSQKDMLYAYIFILHALGFVFSFCKGCIHVRGDVDFSRFTPRPCDGWDRVDLPADLSLQGGGIRPHLFQQLRDEAVILSQKGGCKVLLLYLHVVVFNGDVLCLLDRLQRFLCEFLSVHTSHTPKHILALFSTEC